VNTLYIDNTKYATYLNIKRSNQLRYYVKCSLQCNYRLIEGKLNYNKGDYVGLKHSLDIDWDSTFEPHANDVESLWNVFKDIIISNSRKFIPTVKVFKCPPGKKWCRPLPDNIRNLIKLKSKAWKKCIKTRSIGTLDNYKRVRNDVRNATRSILRAEQDSISKQSKSNPKKFWNYIKTKTRISDSIGDRKYVQVDGSECLAKTDEEKANVFCNYFSSVYVV